MQLYMADDYLEGDMRTVDYYCGWSPIKVVHFQLWAKFSFLQHNFEALQENLQIVTKF